MTESIIEIENLSKSFGDLEVLHNINVEIEKGDIYGLVGVSGAGKSTLLRCVNGLTGYSSGSLKVKGTELNNLNKSQLREVRRNIGMIFQQFSLMERKNVFENIALPLQCWNYDKNKIKERVDELLELVNLSDKANAMPRELSGGQKQRVAIARALTMNPEILLCDEATSALDPNTSQSILRLLKRINEKLDITIIVVTHQMEVVKQICNKMTILKDGELIISDSTVNIFMDNPPALQDLMGEVISEKIASTGINYKFEIQPDTDENKILSKLSLQKQIPYRYSWADTNFFEGRQISFITINVEEEHTKALENFLNEEQVKWMVL